MGQIFRPRANSYARIALGVVLAWVVLSLLLAWAWVRSPYQSGVGHTPKQPVPFSHDHHIDGLGIDCRYCHVAAETSSFAGLPSTEVCMTCHSQLWTNAALLEPVRASWREDQPLRWTRVNDLPDYVYFDHSIHLHYGIGCTTCHGPVGQMPLMRQEASLFMEWCLDCHRAPERYIRPRERVFDPDWTPPPQQAELGRKLVAAYRVRVGQITDCYTCHR